MTLFTTRTGLRMAIENITQMFYTVLTLRQCTESAQNLIEHDKIKTCLWPKSKLQKIPNQLLRGAALGYPRKKMVAKLNCTGTGTSILEFSLPCIGSYVNEDEKESTQIL